MSHDLRPAAPASGSSAPQGARTILLIGEHRFDQVRCKSVLIAAGYRVEQATSTIDGVGLAQQIGPDVILLDVARHGLTRLVPLTALRMDREAARIPVMLITAASDLAALDEGFELGAADFITKPVQWPYLLARLNIVLAARENEQALRPAKTMAQSLSRSSTSLLADASYLMRDALTPIAGFSALMLRETFGPLGDPRYRETACGLAAASQEFLALVENLDDIARIESGDLRLHDDVVSLPDVIEAATQRMKPSALAKSLSLEASVRSRPIRLRGDGARLQQIMRNLLSNAIKCTPAGGFVRIYANEWAAGGVRVVVEDTGIGMSPAELRRIMAAIGDAKLKLKRPAGEPGYGLAIAQALAALHGGDLVVESVPGQGTRASLVLPRERMLQAA